MSHRLVRLAAATLAAAVVIPASAEASPAVSSKVVAKHAQKAVKATATLEKLVVRGKDKRAIVTLKSARRESAAASRTARRMAARARTTSQATAAVGALAAAGALQSSAATDYATLIAEADGKLQTALANALPSALASRDAIIASLQQIVARFDSAKIDAIAAEVLAALTVQVPETITALTELDSEQLPTHISGLVTTAMNTALGILDRITQQLTAIVPTLPSAAQGPVGTALTTVTTLLGSLRPTLEGVSATVASMVDSVMAMVTGLLGKLPIVSGFLPGGGTTPDAGTGDGTDGDVGSVLPDLGGLPFIGGVLDSLLGGLPFFMSRG